MKRFGRFDPLIAGPQMLLAVIGTENVEPDAGLIDLADFPEVHERSWYFAGERRFVEQRPSASHVWHAGAWVLDEALDRQARAFVERAWRDQVIKPAFSLRDRHRDEVDMGGATTLTAEQFAELLGYIQRLRDWPQSPDFPDSQHRPTPPVWIAEQTQ